MSDNELENLGRRIIGGMRQAISDSHPDRTPQFNEDWFEGESRHPPEALLKDLIAYFLYPGQPLILATMIMLVFNDLDDAKNGRAGKLPASSNQRIPGAGDAVASTLNILSDGVKASLDSEVVIEALEQSWAENASSQNPFSHLVDDGLARSRRFNMLFTNVWPSWLEKSKTEGKADH